MNKKMFSVICIICLIAIPAYAERLFFEDFDDNSFADSGLSVSEPNNVLISNARAMSGTRSCKFEDGVTVVNLFYALTPVENQVLYVKYYQYFPSTEWTWENLTDGDAMGNDTGLKQFRWSNVAAVTDGWPLFMFKWYSSDSVNWDLQKRHCYFSDGGISPAPPTGAGLDMPNSFPSYNTWHKVEIIIRLSNTNGGFVWKIDDVIQAGDEDFDYDSWPALIATPTHLYLCGGNGFENAGAYYVDDLEVWNSIPEAEPDPTATGATLTGVARIVTP